MKSGPAPAVRRPRRLRGNKSGPVRRTSKVQRTGPLSVPPRRFELRFWP